MERLLLASLMLLASCGKSGAPDIRVSGAWARETVAGQSATASYMTIANRGSREDRLLGVEADAPATASVHETSTTDGVARMRAVSGLEIPGGRALQLEPGGAHVMVTGLTSPLRAGDSLKLRLRFETSGERVIDVPVKSAI